MKQVNNFETKNYAECVNEYENSVLNSSKARKEIIKYK